MTEACTGCTWIFEEIERRKTLAAEFAARGDYGFAQIAIEAITGLEREWRAHCQRDHAGAPSESLLTLWSAIHAQLAALDPSTAAMVPSLPAA
jgi:hypothetical protein